MKSHKRPLPKRSRLANLLFDRHLCHNYPNIFWIIDHLCKPIKIYQAKLKFKVIPKGIPLLDNCWVRFAVWAWTRFPTSNCASPPSGFNYINNKQHVETSQKHNIDIFATNKNSCSLIIYHQPLNLWLQGTNQWVKSMAMEPLSIEICWWTWLKKLGIRVEGPRTKQQYQQIYNIKT